MKLFKKIWEAITAPFISIAVLIDESKRINEDGSWDKYWEKKNRKEVDQDEKNRTITRKSRRS